MYANDAILLSDSSKELEQLILAGKRRSEDNNVLLNLQQQQTTMTACKITCQQ